MVVGDKFGSKINLMQMKNGGIAIAFANQAIKLNKEDALCFSLYCIDDFDSDAFEKYYQ